MTEASLFIRKATWADFEQIWPIFKAVITTGDTYVFPPDMSFDAAQAYWMDAKHHVYMAIDNGTCVGTYILKENQIGLGNHIANGSFMVHPQFHGKRIGVTLAEHALTEAKTLGFRAMQFNIVISTNEPAVRLWKKVGFQIIGTIPNAFQHQQLGFVDAFIMYKSLV